MSPSLGICYLLLPSKGWSCPSCSSTGMLWEAGKEAGPACRKYSPACAVKTQKALRDPVPEISVPSWISLCSQDKTPRPRRSCWAPGQGLSSPSVPLQPGPDERKSELLPAGWEANKEVYTLRYKSMDDAHELLLKAIMVEDSMILNVMVSTHMAQRGWGPLAEKNTRGNFLNFCLFCLEVVFVPQDGAEPGGVCVADVAQHEAGQTLAVSGQWDSWP